MAGIPGVSGTQAQATRRIEHTFDSRARLVQGEARAPRHDSYMYFPGDDEPRRVTLDADSFGSLATDKPMSEILAAARPAKRGSRADAGGPALSDRIDDASAAHAGKPHKGRITDGEKQLMRERFDDINERLAGQGIRTISLADRERIERYGLEDLAGKRATGVD